MCKHFYDDRKAISVWNRVARRKRLVEIACVNEPLFALRERESKKVNFLKIVTKQELIST